MSDGHEEDQIHAEMLRVRTTLEIEMAHADGRQLGICAVENAKFQRSIRQMAEAANLKHIPDALDVFTPQFLPPIHERVRTLAR